MVIYDRPKGIGFLRMKKNQIDELFMAKWNVGSVCQMGEIAGG